jgi:hypothetical protein
MEVLVGNIKDGYDVGVEALQFWFRFRGKRVRIWPSELTIRICSESGRKWVTPADKFEPPWWEDSRRRYSEHRPRNPEFTRDPLVEYVAEYLANSELPNIETSRFSNIETVEEARLLEATISDVTRNPPGIYLTDIQYWVLLGDAADKKVVKVDSQDEGMLLPLAQLARIDFVPPGPFAKRGDSSWVVKDSPTKSRFLNWWFRLRFIARLLPWYKSVLASSSPNLLASTEDRPAKNRQDA